MDALLLVSTALKVGFVLLIVLTFAPVLIWAERRQSAMIQDRLGPNRAGVTLGGRRYTLGGLLHPLADALKFITKEDFVPPDGDRLLHALGPIVALVPAIAVFGVIPFGGDLYLAHTGEVLSSAVAVSGPRVRLQVADLDIGILYVFGIGGMGVVGAAIAGYASNSKYALLGGMRAAGQMVSYEIALGLSLVGCFMVYGTLRLNEMVSWQREHVWGIFVQPLSFLLFLTAAIAESKRVPFDVPEGESELAAGYFTEYSGMKFGMFFMGEFVEVIATSALLSTLFLGGYDLPFLHDEGFVFGSTWWGIAPHTVPLSHLAVVTLQVLTFLAKLVVLIWLQLMIRWSLLRFRYDQLMHMCWQLLLPLSLANIVITGVVIVLLQ